MGIKISKFIEGAKSADATLKTSAINNTKTNAAEQKTGAKQSASNVSEDNLQTASFSKSLETYPKDDYKSTDWNDIKPVENKAFGIKTGGYAYTTSDGTKIKLDNIDGVIVKQNSNTGEIVLAGLNGGTIKGAGKDIKLTIYDSILDEISLGKGNDSISIFNCEIEKINAGKGNDNINIENSTVNGTIKGGDGDDYIQINKSDVSSIKGETGRDNLLINNSIAKEIYGGADNDVIVLNSVSDVEKLQGDKGNDIINVSNSNIKTLDGSKGADNIIVNNADIGVLNEDKNDTISSARQMQSKSALETLDEESINEAINITKTKTSGYNHTLTSEEEVYAVTVDFFENNLKNMQIQFDEQEKEDGAVSDAYNWVKQLTDLGVSKDDINSAIKEQEKMVQDMKDAIDGKGDKSFEDVFKDYTGIEYDENNVTEYLETSQMYSLALTGLVKSDNFKQQITKAKNLGEVSELYTNYYGGEELGREKLNELLQETFMENPMEFGYPSSVEINENNELVITRPKEYGAMGPIDGTEYETTVEDISEVTNMMSTMTGFFNLDRYADDFKDNMEKVIGCSFEELQNEYASKQLKTFGKGNSFQKLIDRYCEEQEGFKDKLASTVQKCGLGMMAAGGIICIAFPPASGAGIGLMNAGKFTAYAGMVTDNALDLIDEATSENKMSDEEVLAFAKKSITELALWYSGRQINGVAEGVKSEVFSATQSKSLAFLSQVGTDVSLSLLADLMITGEVNISGESVSQIMALITGLAGARVDSYTKEKLSTDTTKTKAPDDTSSAVTTPDADFNSKYIQQLIDAGFSDYATRMKSDLEADIAMDGIKSGWDEAKLNRYIELTDAGVDSFLASDGINANWTDKHWKAYSDLSNFVSNKYALNDMKYKINMDWSADDFSNFVTLVKSGVGADTASKGINSNWSADHWNTYNELVKYSNNQLALDGITNQIDFKWSLDEFSNYAKLVTSGTNALDASAVINGTNIKSNEYKLSINPNTGKQNLDADMFFVNVQGYGRDTDWGTKMAKATENTSELVSSGADYTDVMSYFINETRQIQADAAKAKSARTGQGLDTAMVNDYGTLRMPTDIEKNHLIMTPLGGRYSYFIDKLIAGSGTSDTSVNYKTTSSEFPLAKTTNVVMDLENGSASLFHPEGNGNIKYAESIYDNLIKMDNPSPDYVIDSVAKMHWLLAQNAPFVRGSDSISSGMSKAILRAYDIEVSPLKDGVSVDFEAFSSNMEDFVKNYRSFYVSEPKKIN